MVSSPQSALSRVSAKGGKTIAKSTSAATNAAVSKMRGEAAAQKAVQADPTYIAAHTALQSQLQQYGSNLATQANRYDAQYGEDLGNLGLQNSQGVRYSNPDVGQYTPHLLTNAGPHSDSFALALNRPHAAAGGFNNWDQIHQNTSSGRAFTDQSNDYAARGMIQSGDARGLGGGYINDRANLGGNFQQQAADAGLARNNYLGDLTNQAQSYTGQQNDSLNQARVAALANYNAQQASNAVRVAAFGKTS